MVYPNPVPMAWGTAAAEVMRAGLLAASAANDCSALPRAVDSGDLRFDVIYASVKGR